MSHTKTMEDSDIGYVKRVLPAQENSINDIFVNSHTKLAATFAICRKLLDKKADYLILHGMGRSIAKTVRLANLLKDTMQSSVSIHVRSGTITAKDVIYGKLINEDGQSGETVRERPVSVINIRVARISA